MIIYSAVFIPNRKTTYLSHGQRKEVCTGCEVVPSIPDLHSGVQKLTEIFSFYKIKLERQILLKIKIKQPLDNYCPLQS